MCTKKINSRSRKPDEIGGTIERLITKWTSVFILCTGHVYNLTNHLNFVLIVDNFEINCTRYMLHITKPKKIRIMQHVFRCFFFFSKSLLLYYKRFFFHRNYPFQSTNDISNCFLLLHIISDASSIQHFFHLLKHFDKSRRLFMHLISQFFLCLVALESMFSVRYGPRRAVGRHGDQAQR